MLLLAVTGAELGCERGEEGGRAATGGSLYREDPAPGPAAEAGALREGARGLLARTRAIRARAPELDAEALLRALAPNENSGPVVRLDDRLADARVTGPAAGPDASIPGGLRLEFEGTDPVALAPAAGDATLADGTLQLRQERDDFLVSQQPVAIERDAIGEIELRLRVARSAQAVLGWTTDGPDERPEGWAGLRERSGVVTVDLVPDGRFHRYRIDAAAALRRGAGRGPVLRSVFLRLSKTPGEPVAVDFLRFVPRRARYAERIAGRAFEVRGGEMRPVLHQSTPSRVTFEVDVPRHAPRLEFGLAVLEGGDPIRFSVSVGGAEAFAATVGDPEGWSDASVPLAAFAGQRVRVELAAESAGGNVAFWSSPTISGDPPRAFHVIVLLEDALRADALSAYGNPDGTSPHHDALAARGVLFERAWAQATKTRPSCPSFMTSLLPSATGVWTHTDRLGDRYLTLAEVLRSQGFRTASFLQNSNAGPAAGLHQGFDHVFEPSRMGEGPEIFDAAAAWLAARADRNLFAYVHVLDPHGVYDPPAPFEAPYRERGPGQTPAPADRRLFDPDWVDTPTAEGRRLLYHGEVRHNDHHLGRFLDALAGSGVLEQALVVSIADHGEHLGEDARWGHNPPGTPGVTHVPLVFAHPSLPAGVRIGAHAQLLDLAPTVLELAGVDVSGLPFQGESLVPSMRGASGEEPLAGRTVVSEEPTLFRDRLRPRRSGSLFHRDRQLLRSAAAGAAAAPADPWAREADAILGELQREGRAIWEALGRESAAEVRLDPASQEQLRALGYLD